MEFLGNVLPADILLEDLVASLNIISTGCSPLDEILGRGLYSGEITEIFGLSGVGKSQFCLSIATHVADELAKNVLYVDTGTGFNSERIYEILSKKHNDTNVINLKKCMTRIQCVKTFEIFHAFILLDQIKKQLSCEENSFYKDVVLLVFDSVDNIVSPVLGGFGHGLMIQFAHSLKGLAYDHNVAVLVTNSVILDTKTKDYTRPALGVSWERIPHNRIFLKHCTMQKKQENSGFRWIKLVKSCRMPLKESVVVSISELGLH
ncbi:DNA repair protein RAD51 homolog 4-like [Xenia sp. Carnegie-2017]|uniref:DNA repair protein RAD51 homolog 4-like n=1 Tax=Xenia sp. Carnegie-2017 TaxID=2897299 RepID=UPI001F0505B2|nr:DNA repair protein RAD51 homolog 4-like [Xenia sp. Carnegie-2017]